MARIIVFGPHPDDQELGMGGTIARLARQGHDLLLVDLTNGEPTPHGTPAMRAREAAAATEILTPAPSPEHPGARPIRRILLGLRNRELEHSIEARHLAASAIRAWRADILFSPFPADAHPDHRAGTRIVEDARFDAKLTKLDLPWPHDHWTGDRFIPSDADAGEHPPPCYPKWLIHYYATHLRIVPSPSFLIDISDQLEIKLDAVRAYESQFLAHEKNRRVLATIEHAARYFGSRIGAEAAEPFHTDEPLGLASLEGLSL
ncbi:MAG: PIG-L family deacetylase [Planctomycetota bacterium]